MPKDGTDLPVVIVVLEIFGVHDHFKDICRRFGKKGNLAIAPDLYVRQGDVSDLKEFFEILKVVSKLPDEQVMSDMDAAVAWTNASGNPDAA